MLLSIWRPQGIKWKRPMRYMRVLSRRQRPLRNASVGQVGQQRPRRSSFTPSVRRRNSGPKGAPGSRGGRRARPTPCLRTGGMHRHLPQSIPYAEMLRYVYHNPQKHESNRQVFINNFNIVVSVPLIIRTRITAQENGANELVSSEARRPVEKQVFPDAQFYHRLDGEWTP